MTPEEIRGKAIYIEPAEGVIGMNALHAAAYWNDPDAVRAALQRGMAVDAGDDHGWTPLHWSIDMSQAWGRPEEVVALLLEAGASPNAIDNNGYSVLMMACSRNNNPILELLLNAGADIHHRIRSTTPLHEAVHCNFGVAIRRLLELGADPYQVDSEGCTVEQMAELLAEPWCGFEQGLAAFRAVRPATAPTPPLSARSQSVGPMIIVPGDGVTGCGVGGTVQDAVAVFGDPSSWLRDDLRFSSRGVDVRRHRDGRIRGLIFYFRSSIHQPFSGSTDKGIGRESTAEAVLQAYGKPERIGEGVVSEYGPEPGAPEHFLRYSKLGVAFTFHDRRLADIRVFARED